MSDKGTAPKYPGTLDVVIWQDTNQRVQIRGRLEPANYPRQKSIYAVTDIDSEEHFRIVGAEFKPKSMGAPSGGEVFKR
ncbi:MAG: hypothetical protein AAB685_02445, partial [Patescibacteria group bacterium]